MDRAQPGARGSTNRNIEFDATYSGDSLAVTIVLGEAFVDGWLARDVTTDITLDVDTDRQTIVIGWGLDAIYDDQQHDVRDEADRVIDCARQRCRPHASFNWHLGVRHGCSGRHCC